MKKILFVHIKMLLTMTLFAQGQGLFDGVTNVGNSPVRGSCIYIPTNQEYLLEGAGENMWADKDQFLFAWKKLRGDFMIAATIRFIGKGANEHRKIGLMARDQLTPGSMYADACVHGSTLTSLQFRESDGGQTDELTLSSFHPNNIMLERKGNVFTFYAAVFGENYKSVSKEILLNEEVYAGIFLCSHEKDITEKAVFSNVRISIPPPTGYQPYRDFIGSELEVMDVFTGKRKVLLSVDSSIQAPNWTPDGKSLIYNSAAGLLHRYDFENGGVSQLNTGTAVHNNNDHVLSFDGKQLAISNHVGEKGISTIFVLPATGSHEPQQITAATEHSYLHGWSPDGRQLLFTGERNGQFDIWAVDIATKKETQLTNTPGLDDGPEYTPDGKWIYFNSVRTGTMQIWRMEPDGGAQEQVTFDEYNNWFPHISPDGKWIVYIAFPKDIDPSSHPFYQKVYLKLMPVSGGAARTIGYLYGGQGSINVPSWSPDSKQIAFVSNTNNR